MNSDDATRQVIEVLGEMGISYMLVGSLSSGFYGIARSTKDADFVVQLERASVMKIASRLAMSFAWIGKCSLRQSPQQRDTS